YEVWRDPGRNWGNKKQKGEAEHTSLLCPRNLPGHVYLFLFAQPRSHVWHGILQALPDEEIDHPGRENVSPAAELGDEDVCYKQHSEYHQGGAVDDRRDPEDKVDAALPAAGQRQLQVLSKYMSAGPCLKKRKGTFAKVVDAQKFRERIVSIRLDEGVQI